MHNHSIYFKQNPCQNVQQIFGVFLYCFVFQNFKKIKYNQTFINSIAYKKISDTIYVNFSKAFVNFIREYFIINDIHKNFFFGVISKPVSIC